MNQDDASEAQYARFGDPRIAEQILETFRSAGLAPVWAKLLALARPSARLIPTAERQRGLSKLGGRPDVDQSFEWPRAPDGAPLSFVAQVDLSEVGLACRNDLLPGSGLLAFFYDAARLPGGDRPSDRGHWAVHHSPARVHAAEVPDDLEPGETFKETPLTLRGELTLPGLRTVEVENLRLTDSQEDAYIGLRQALEEQHSPSIIDRILGWPEEIQHDPSSYVQLPANGINGLDPEVYKRDEVKELLAERSAWRLVLQVDSEHAAGMDWGDSGRLYFMMRELDLREQAWDRAWISLQEY